MKISGIFLIVGLCLGCTSRDSKTELPILAASWIDDNGNEVAYQPPSFELTDQHNQPFSSKELEGKIHVVDFFFTSCPTICPKMTSHLKTIQDYFQKNNQVVLVSFSIDPIHDDATRLNTYAEAKGIYYKQWKLLNDPDKKTVYDLAKEYKIRAFEEQIGEERNLLHDGTFILLDEQGRVRGYYDGLSAETPKQLIQDIQKLLT